MDSFCDKINDKPINELLDEWKSRVEDDFGIQIKLICEQTKDYFKKQYYTNPMNSFVWFYGMSGDKEKTYEKIESYMLHSQELMASMTPEKLDNLYKALCELRMIIDNDGVGD